MRSELRDEAGYSLVELLVAMMLLSIAIIPMVGMFDMGLRSATNSGRYDEARSLANARLEEIKSLPFADADGVADGTPDSLIEKYEPRNEPGGGPERHDCGSPDFSDCDIVTTYVQERDYSTPTNNKRTFWVLITVTVEWDGGSFETTGLSAREL